MCSEEALWAGTGHTPGVSTLPQPLPGLFMFSGSHLLLFAFAPHAFHGHLIPSRTSSYRLVDSHSGHLVSACALPEWHGSFLLGALQLAQTPHAQRPPHLHALAPSRSQLPTREAWHPSGPLPLLYHHTHGQQAAEPTPREPSGSPPVPTPVVATTRATTIPHMECAEAPSWPPRPHPFRSGPSTSFPC